MSDLHERMAHCQVPLAVVATRHIAGEMGGATVYCVVLPDGFILECGCDGFSQKRAVLLAETINKANPHAFQFGRAS